MDSYTSQTREKIVNKSITIDAPASKVWNTLTHPDLMKKWMSPEEITIITDWKVGNSFIIQGNVHGIDFENRGTVLQFEPEKILQYNHLSSLSELTDEAINYVVIDFRLTSMKNETTLTLTLSNFPTESIYKHLVFYWNVTLEIIKKMIENQPSSLPLE